MHVAECFFRLRPMGDIDLTELSSFMPGLDHLAGFVLCGLTRFEPELAHLTGFVTFDLTKFHGWLAHIVIFNVFELILSSSPATFD